MRKCATGHIRNKSAPLQVTHFKKDEYTVYIGGILPPNVSFHTLN
ncbi:hypothetical protein U2A4042190033 [Corynebacterium striatum]|nr:hypothetical protein U2A4042190033 [Corynebacterium striatum]